MECKQKTEFPLLGKESRFGLKPRILLDDPEISYHAQHRTTDKDNFDDKLVWGDLRLVLRPEASGQNSRASLSDHPIAMARSGDSYRLSKVEKQVMLTQSNETPL